MVIIVDKVGPDTVVGMRYTLKSDAGKVLDESGDEIMPYLHGHENIVPGLEKQLEGRAIGDRVQAVVPPEEGYGLREGETQLVPRDAFPDDADLAIGMQFLAEGPDDEAVPLWVVGLTDTAVEVDRNHPLAGMTLTFDVEIVSIRAATEEELEHGHPHEGGHHHH